MVLQVPTELMEATARWELEVHAMEVHVHLAMGMLAELVELAVKAAAELRVELAVPHKQEIRIPGLWAWQEQEEMEAQVQEAVQEEMSVLIIMLD
jgi:hypothetical protein